MISGIIYSILLVFFVFLLIFFVIYIYRSVYKRNANRALEGVHTTHLVDPLSFFQIIVMIVTLILSAVAITRIGELKGENTNLLNKLNTIETRLNSIVNNMVSLESSFSNYINSQKWIQVSKYEYKNCDIDGQTIETQISFTLKEVESGSVISIIATNTEDETDFIKMNVSSMTLSYSGTIDLDMDKKYQISVMAETESHSSGEVMFEIDLSNIFNLRINFSAGVSGNESKNTSVNGYFDNQGIDNWTLSTLELRFYDGNNQLVSSVDLAPYLQMSISDKGIYFNYETDVTNPIINQFTIKAMDSFGRIWESEPIIYDMD